jgi:nitrite reductase/ring-hydroxylating ferredoxin subunit
MPDIQPHLAGDSSDFMEGAMVERLVNGRELILVRRQGVLLCFLDQCSHQPVKLSEFGQVQGGQLVCHAHGGVFDLDREGRVLCPPPKEGLTPFKVIERDGQVFVFI